MSLRIGFDLDGVLADMESELVRQAELLFGEPVARSAQRVTSPPDLENVDEGPETGREPPPPTLTSLQMSPRQAKRLWRHVATIDSFWETLKEVEAGAVARLSNLAIERRWEVIFITKRPETAGATPQVQSQRWLEAQGFSLPSVFVVHGSRGLVARALNLDFVIDDRPENCLDVVVDSKARAILVWREDEKLLPVPARRVGIGVVKLVGESLEMLLQADAAHRERPGIVDKVKRRLGFGQATTV